MVASRSALVLPWRPASGAVARRIGRGEGHVERGEFQKKGGALNSSQLNMNIFPSTPPGSPEEQQGWGRGYSYKLDCVKFGAEPGAEVLSVLQPVHDSAVDFFSVAPVC